MVGGRIALTLTFAGSAPASLVFGIPEAPPVQAIITVWGMLAVSNTITCPWIPFEVSGACGITFSLSIEDPFFGYGIEICSITIGLAVTTVSYETEELNCVWIPEPDGNNNNNFRRRRQSRRRWVRSCNAETQCDFEIAIFAEVVQFLYRIVVTGSYYYNQMVFEINLDINQRTFTGDYGPFWNKLIYRNDFSSYQGPRNAASCEWQPHYGFYAAGMVPVQDAPPNGVVILPLKRSDRTLEQIKETAIIEAKKWCSWSWSMHVNWNPKIPGTSMCRAVTCCLDRRTCGQWYGCSLRTGNYQDSNIDMFRNTARWGWGMLGERRGMVPLHVSSMPNHEITYTPNQHCINVNDYFTPIQTQQNNGELDMHPVPSMGITMEHVMNLR